MEIAGLTPDEQMRLLCETNGPITMLVAMEQFFREESERVRLPKPGEFVAARNLKTNLTIADGLASLIRSVAGH